MPIQISKSTVLQNCHVKKPSIEFKNHYNQFFFQTRVFIAPLSTNIGLIHRGISKTKCNI
jgi:hypothetical protein